MQLTCYNYIGILSNRTRTPRSTEEFYSRTARKKHCARNKIYETTYHIYDLDCIVYQSTYSLAREHSIDWLWYQLYRNYFVSGMKDPTSCLQAHLKTGYPMEIETCIVRRLRGTDE